MSSAIQVLANLPHMYEYFVDLKLHNRQLNPRSVMGHKGKLALGFASLMNQMWGFDG
jgi:hypothetical protein